MDLVTVQIAALIQGEVQFDPVLVDALALLSIGVTAFCIIGYQGLTRMTQRWAR